MIKRLSFGISLVVVLTLNGNAQELRRFDITASVGIADAGGDLLPGSNPDVTGETNGCLVQILDVGPNGVADLPALNGNPGGDDFVSLTTVIGKGIAPNVPVSGRFSTSVFPAPTVGRRLYGRVFDAATVAAATRWGQSASFVVVAGSVMDVSVLGLGATTQTVGIDPKLVDSDGDGRTDYEELVANTNPLDGQDVLASGPLDLGLGDAALPVDARAGREYILQRGVDLQGWQDVGPTQSVVTGSSLWLQDPNPPNSSKVFYRVRVRLP